MKTVISSSTTVHTDRYTNSSMVKITSIVTMVILTSVLSPLWCMSDTSADGPVTYVVTPLGGAVRFTMSRTAAIDSSASVVPWLPARLSWTYTALPSGLWAPGAVIGSPQKSCTCWMCAGSARSCLMMLS